MRAGRADADDVTTRVWARVAAALARADAAPVLVAVSGGRDSLVLLDALLAMAPERVAGVAAFDHGTGEAARAGVRRAEAAARGAGVPVWIGRAEPETPGTEAGWRRIRWRFLRQAAREAGGGTGTPATVATGHTADDQVETVLMRAIRGAGARGLAGLAAEAPGIERPLLAVPRADVAAYAEARALSWVDDPGNLRRAHLRNRVRLDLLPALRRARPGVEEALLALGRGAAAWRKTMDAAADALVLTTVSAPDVVAVSLRQLAPLDDLALRALWPALAARIGGVLDRRGTVRLAQFTIRSAILAGEGGPATARQAPVAGGIIGSVELVPAGAAAPPERAMVLRRRVRHATARQVALSTAVPLDPDALAGGVWFGGWQFVRAADAPDGAAAPDDPWTARLCGERRYVVRGWRPGDRMPFRPDGAARRVKRFLADRRVPARERVGWPVVVAHPALGAAGASDDAPADAGAGEIVWIPGVRRSPAAPARPGQPGLVLLCARPSDR